MEKIIFALCAAFVASNALSTAFTAGEYNAEHPKDAARGALVATIIQAFLCVGIYFGAGYVR